MRGSRVPGARVRRICFGYFDGKVRAKARTSMASLRGKPRRLIIAVPGCALRILCSTSCGNLLASVPINAGTINALRPVAQVDTSTGQGPTQVFTTSGVFSLNAPTERSAWATVNFPLGTVSMVQAGSLSDRATVNVNGDIWFRALDGIRSFMVARRDFSSSWVNAPMSRELSRVIDGGVLNDLDVDLLDIFAFLESWFAGCP